MEESVHQIVDVDTIRVSLGTPIVTVTTGPNIWLHPSMTDCEVYDDLADILMVTFPNSVVSLATARPEGTPNIAVFYDAGTPELRPYIEGAEYMLLAFGRSLSRVVFFEPPRMRPREVTMNLRSMASREEATAAMLDVIDLLLEPRETALQLETPSPVVLIDTYAHFQEIVKEMADDEQRLLTLTPRQFEKFFAKLLERDGLEVILTKATRDGGADVLAYRKEQFGKILYAYECKRYQPNNPVGPAVVRRLIGTTHLKDAKAGIILTTSRFTSGAIDEAEQSKIIYPQNAQDLRTWLQRLRDGGAI